MGLIIGGIVLIGIGIILWVLKGKKAGKSVKLELLDTTPIKDIIENFESISGSMGAGSFSNHVEVKGVAHSDQGLRSDLSEEDVVYSQTVVVHEYEKLESSTDTNGKKTQEWVSHTTTVSDNSRWVEGFGVKDSTGFIAITPANSQLHTEKLFEKFEEGEAEESGLSGRLKGIAGGIAGAKSANTRTRGYRYTETGIRLGTPLYVVGNANDRNGGLAITMSQNKGEDFIVSVKTKDQLLGSLSSAVKGLKIGAYIFWVGGAALLVYGIIKMI